MGNLDCEMAFSHRHFLKQKTDWSFYLAGPLIMNWIMIIIITSMKMFHLNKVLCVISF